MLLHIREVLGSDLFPETDHATWDFPIVSLNEKFWTVFQIRAQLLPSTFPILYLLFIPSFHYTVFRIESFIKPRLNKYIIYFDETVISIRSISQYLIFIFRETVRNFSYLFYIWIMPFLGLLPGYVLLFYFVFSLTKIMWACWLRTVFLKL
jgi:hypothetical protein